jgi:peptide-methionine (S)-S-oxide reductase
MVSSHKTGHKEVVEVTYDPAIVSYDKLLDIFWHNIDPLDAGGQFCDRGEQYQSAIFVGNEAEQAAVAASMKVLEEKLGQKIVTLILPAAKFWPAEKYHQNYATENPFRYGFYRSGCGRDSRLKAVWGKDAGGH